jgi:hypothetical protein
MSKELKLRYKTPADRTNDGWEKYSLPIGNGYGGASIFGGTDVERLQFTTNVFANTFRLGGVSNFLELCVEFNDVAENYERGLDIKSGIAFSSYKSAFGLTKRDAFFSYPDNVFVYHAETERPKDLTVRALIPYLGVRNVDDGGRTGGIFANDGCIEIKGTLPSRDLSYDAKIAVITDGEKVIENGEIIVKNALCTVILFVFDTSYKLCPEAFSTHKAVGEDPTEKVATRLNAALKLGYEKLKERHIADFSSIMDRVEFDIGGSDDGRTTEELLESYKNGNDEPYPEELYYQYGRYLLVSSSRKGTPPASLQGVWTVHDKSPWGSGFWHNINIQMNYWHAFGSNIAETFDAYADFFKAYLPEAEKNAKEWIKETNPENSDGDCGWIIGTGAFCYEVEGKNPNSHSGPGTGGLTAKMFYDAYDFTRDKEFLKNYAYPAVHGMAKFLKKTLRDYDGRKLCSFSASPEQILSGEWVNEHKYQQYYHTVGCSFDQQMVKEVFADDLKLSGILGVYDETNKYEEENLGSLDAIRVGYSGQIKEYDEENFYGEIGEAKHRHLSQLVALMPGEQITRDTPATLDAAKITLDYRGDESTGWALAHRLCSRARTGDGDHAYLLLQNLLKKRTHPNLWDVHPPFQIDGNFGATAGITEMLLQSHGGFVSLLPALPEKWKRVKFKGLKARGDFEVSLVYADGVITECEIVSGKGEPITICYGGSADNIVVENGGREISVNRRNTKISFATKVGEKYRLRGFEKRDNRPAASCFVAKWQGDGVKLEWLNDGNEYKIFRAKNSEPCYTLIGKSHSGEYLDKDFSVKNKIRLTYKLVIGDADNSGSGSGVTAVLNPASELEKERYAYRLKVNNINISDKQ